MITILMMNIVLYLMLMKISVKFVMRVYALGFIDEITQKFRYWDIIFKFNQIFKKSKISNKRNIFKL